MHSSQTQNASSSIKTADMPRTPPYSQARPNIVYDELFLTTSNTFLGPMSLVSFFNRYLPNDPNSGPQPQSRSIRDRRMRSGKNVFHPVFIRALQATRLCPGFDFEYPSLGGVDHEPNTLRPIISAFKQARHSSATADKRPAEFFMMCLPLEEDPFTGSQSSPEVTSSERYFEGMTDATQMIVCNLVTDVYREMLSQRRCFMFTALFLQDHVRFIRWDWAGAVVTQRFSWKDDPAPLEMLLWRVSHLSDAGRGHDTSISKPAAEEIAAAKKRLDERARELAEIRGDASVATRYSTDDTFRKFRVVDNVDYVERFFVASEPVYQSNAVMGRGVAGYEALDLQTDKLVYMKDVWQWVDPDLCDEGLTYRRLHKMNVPWIAPLVCSGQIDDQKTLTHAVKSRPWCCKGAESKAHEHHRLVLGALGRPLREFRSTKELCTVIFEGMEAHQAAFTLARILHSDISDGNILITDDGHAFLIDWEMAQKVNDDGKGDYEGRSGTWVFMSSAMCTKIKRHEFRDDLESFFYLLLFNSIRYQVRAPPDLAALLETSGNFFQSAHYEGDELCGGSEKAKYLSAATDVPFFPRHELEKMLGAPHASLIEEVRLLFRPAYLVGPDLEEATSEAKRKLNLLWGQDALLDHLESSKVMAEVFQRHLAMPGWRERDRGHDLFPDWGAPSMVPAWCKWAPPISLPKRSIEGSIPASNETSTSIPAPAPKHRIRLAISTSAPPHTPSRSAGAPEPPIHGVKRARDEAGLDCEENGGKDHSAPSPKRARLSLK